MLAGRNSRKMLKPENENVILYRDNKEREAAGEMLR